MAWTEEDEAEWSRIAAIPVTNRHGNDRHAFIALQARRNLEGKISALEEERQVEARRRAIERAGPLHKAGVVVMIASLGSCGIGIADGSHRVTLIGVGVGLLLLAGLLTWLNQLLTGTRR